MASLKMNIPQGYEFFEQIGKGGFGAVYRALQTSTGRDVAVKVILPQLADHPDFIRRFEVECQIIAQLEHPCITPLYDYWRDSSGTYLVMRLLRGGNLRDALRHEAFTIEPTALLLDQMASALHFAHRNNVVHRDLKPENILFDEDGNAYLADFGIAKDINISSKKSMGVDGIIGSPDYLSPEQIRNEPISPQTDIYALATVIYEAMTCQHPFPDVSQVERVFSHLNHSFPLITHLSKEIADEVNKVIQRASAKDPVSRYPDILGFATAFREAAKLTRPQVNENVIEVLTLREHEILQLIINGKSNKEIAEALYVTLGTVKWYIKQIYNKLHVRSRVQAIVRARELHLIGADTSSRHSLHTEEVSSITLPQPQNPYKGLQAFQSADSHKFFGREALIENLIERMAEASSNRIGSESKVLVGASPFARFLAIVGPSGSGKSSLVKAGLIPSLWRGDLPGSDRWFVVDMMPGSRPMEELEVALTRIASNYATNLHEQLQRDQHGLVRVAQLILPDDGSELVLVIDQFEELFTLVDDEKVRVHFLNNLVAAVTDPRSRVRIVITLRADFYDRPLHYAAFGDMLRMRLVTILPLSPDGLERAIVQPSQQVGVSFEEGLVASIIAEVNYQPSVLPLLQYTLTELFEQRQGQVLSHDAYRMIGGAVGGLAHQGNQIFEGLDSQHKEAVRQMFLHLLTLEDGTEAIRRRVARSELLTIGDALGNGVQPDVIDELIDLYAAYRLLTLDYDPKTHTPTVEIAHEALIRVWEPLGRWVNDSRQDLEIRRRLTAAAVEWENTHRDASFLAMGTRLGQFQALAATSNIGLNKHERIYLNTSIAEHQRQSVQRERQQRRLLRLQSIILVMLVISLSVSSVLVKLMMDSRAEALSQTRIALSRQLAAQAVAESRSLIGNDELVALLAIRSLEYQYNAVADGILIDTADRLPVRSFDGHSGEVYSVAFSPDGRYLVTGSEDSTARLWDVSTGQEVRAFVGHSSEVYSVAFSPDGRYLVTGSEDSTARLWDVSTGQEVRAFVGHSSGVYNVAFSLDGEMLLTRAEDYTERLWETATGQQIQVRADQDSAGRGGAFSPDGKYVAFPGPEYSAVVWAVGTNEVALTLRGHDNNVHSIAFSPDGKFILTGSMDNSARLWDSATGTVIGVVRVHSGTVRSVVFSPDGKYFVTGSSDHTARLWETATLNEVGSFRAHLDRIWSVAFSPDGEYIVTGSADSTAKLWRIKPERTLVGHTDEVFDVALSPDGNYAVTGSADDTAIVWDVATRQPIHTLIGHTKTVYSVAFSPDGAHVLTGSADSTAKLWNTTTGELEQTFSGHTERVFGIAFSPNGNYVVTGSSDHTAILWDIATGQAIRTFVGHTDEVLDVAFSPDGNYIVTGSADNTANVWDINNRQVVQVLRGHLEVVNGVAFSPDGNHIVTASADRTAILWETKTGERLRTFSGHINSIYQVAFSPSGKSIVTGSADRAAIVWNVNTGERIRILQGHDGAVWGVAFSPHEQYILTGSLDYTASFWLLDYHALVESICHHIWRDFTDEERKLFHVGDDKPTCL